MALLLFSSVSCGALNEFARGNFQRVGSVGLYCLSVSTCTIPEPALHFNLPPSSRMFRRETSSVLLFGFVAVLVEMAASSRCRGGFDLYFVLDK